MSYDDGYGGYGYAGGGSASRGYGDDSYGAPYGHGDPNSYGPGLPRSAGYFEAGLQPGQSETFTRQSGYRTASVYAVRGLDDTAYARYTTYDAATGLYHTDSLYTHPGAYSNDVESSYYAHHADGYSFDAQTTSYDYHPGGYNPSDLIDTASKSYNEPDGSSLEVVDYFRSDSTHSDTDPTTTTYQSEARTSTDAYGYSQYSFTSSSQTFDF